MRQPSGLRTNEDAPEHMNRRGPAATGAFDQVEVVGGDELDAWLQANHERQDSVWLVTYKKQRIGFSNTLFPSRVPAGKALDHPLNRPLGLFAAG